MNNPGKYDDLCTMVRKGSHAQGVALIIIGGDKGQGFSVQGTRSVLALLPDMLEFMAAKIRKDLP
jgi:hypothetical protein